MKKMQVVRKRMESVLAQEITTLRSENTRLNAECNEHLQARNRLARHLNAIFKATIDQTDPNAVHVTDPNRAEDDYTLAALAEIIKLHTENERLRALHTDEKPLVRLLVTSETILMLPNDTTTTGANLVKVMTDLDAENTSLRADLARHAAVVNAARDVDAYWHDGHFCNGLVSCCRCRLREALVALDAAKGNK
jgi:hypothetical protein